MTVLGIAAVVAITLALAGLLDSFNTTLDASRAEALAGSRQRLTVDLAVPRPTAGASIRAIASSPVIGSQQRSLRFAAVLTRAHRRLDAFVEVVEPSGPLWHPTLHAGTLPASRPGLVIAQRAAEDLRVRIGDSVSVSYPVPSGENSYRLTSAELPITGIHTSPLRFISYANPPAARTMQLAGLVNRVSVTPAPGRTATDVKRALLAVPAVTAVQGAAATTDAVDQTMSKFTDVLIITVAIAMAMSLLIAYNTAAINAEERTREHATLFAHGIGALRVVRGNMLEALLTGTLATLIGVAAGYGILRWIATVWRDTMPDLGVLISIAAATYGLAALAGIVSVTLAPILTLKRLRRTDIPSALRVVE